MVVQCNDANFQLEVLKSPLPVLCCFHATWCPLSSAFLPIFTQFSDSFNRVKFVSVNVDDGLQYVAEYSLRGVPAILLFKNGTLCATKLGALSLVQLPVFVNYALS